VQGHRLGLCQTGAAGMARAGAGFLEILDHYYPGTSVIETGRNAIFLLPPLPALRHSKD
jgi:peptidoglycan hydrolase-like amidase